MKTKNILRNQKGMVPIWELLLIVAVVGALGFVGYRAYQARQTKPATTSTSTPLSTSKKEVDPYEGWKTYSNTELGFSHRYPDGANWTQTANINERGDLLYSKGRRAGASVKYTAADCGPNCGLVFSINIYAKGSQDDPTSEYGDRQMSGNNYYSLASKTTVIVDGVSATKWEYKPSDNSSGTVTYYYLTSGNYSYVVDVNGNGALYSQVNFNEFGDKIFASIDLH